MERTIILQHKVSPKLWTAIAHHLKQPDITEQEVIEWLEEGWVRDCEGWLQNANEDGVINSADDDSWKL